MFAELTGVPVMVNRRPYAERMVQFRPFACSDFIIPMLGRLCPPEDKMDRFVREQPAFFRRKGTSQTYCRLTGTRGRGYTPSTDQHTRYDEAYYRVPGIGRATPHPPPVPQNNAHPTMKPISCQRLWPPNLVGRRVGGRAGVPSCALIIWL